LLVGRNRRCCVRFGLLLALRLLFLLLRKVSLTFRKRVVGFGQLITPQLVDTPKVTRTYLFGKTPANSINVASNPTMRNVYWLTKWRFAKSQFAPATPSLNKINALPDIVTNKSRLLTAKWPLVGEVALVIRRRHVRFWPESGHEGNSSPFLTRSVVTSVSKKQDSSGPREPVPYARLQKANVRFPPDEVAQRLRSSGDAPLLPPHARSGHCEPRIARRGDVLAMLSVLARAGRVRSKTRGMRRGRTQITMHCPCPTARTPLAANARGVPRRRGRSQP